MVIHFHYYTEEHKQDILEKLCFCGPNQKEGHTALKQHPGE